MTPQEAIELVTQCGLNIECTKHDECLNAIVSALEKQIPKKVTHEATLQKCCTCPHCKNVVDELTDFLGKRVRVTVPRCKFCGQAIDWSEE